MADMLGRCCGLGLRSVLGLALASPLLAAAPDTLEGLAGLYAADQAEAALAELGAWEAERIEREAEALASAAERAERQLRLPDGGPYPRLLLTAALLHAHRALLDGEAAELERCRLQLTAAATLLLAATRKPGCPVCGPFVRRLFLLLALTSHATLQLWNAESMALAGLERFPEDPELLTVLGSVKETVASVRRYDPSPDQRRGSQAPAGGYRIEGELGDGRTYRLPSASLSEAEACYSQALTRQPGLAEARLRLGRVRTLQGRAAQALPDLERLGREEHGPPRQRYLAWLFAGQAREQLGELPAAATAYRAALEVEPEGQSAWVGLAHALEQQGEHQPAQVAVGEALRAEGLREDPWWSYRSGQHEPLAALLQELREELPR